MSAAAEEPRTRSSWWPIDPETGEPLPSRTPAPLEDYQGSDVALISERFAAIERTLLTRDQLADLPEPEPLIEDTLDKRTVALLTGYWGTGKSFLALDWAACIATEKKWQGRPLGDDLGPVIYIAAEGAYGLHQRLTSWETAWQRDIYPDMLRILPRPINLFRSADVHVLEQLLPHFMPSLVIVDTLARCTVGMDENNAGDMGTVVDNLYRLRDATRGGSVLVVHHTGKDKTTSRGSSALEAGVDTVYQVEGEGGRFTLKRTKRKDGPTDDVVQLKLDPVKGQESVVVVSTGGVDIRPSAEALMSTYLSTFEGVGCSKSELRNVAGLAAGTFHRALSDLVRTGALVNTGTDKRPFYREAGA